jgi:uncharacterized protein YbjT (DUF2867 family)
MQLKRVLILGGSGFIGSALAEQFSKRGMQITVPTRNRDRAKHLLVLPACEVIVANIFDRATLQKLIVDADCVVNLVGILHGDFDRVHVQFPKLVAELCAVNNTPRLLHMSALNADVNGPSAYLQSRGKGEAAVREAVGAKVGAALGNRTALTIFRPSVVFGAEDKFLNLFSGLLKIFPIIPLGSPNALFQPIWVEDVARAIAESAQNTVTFGQSYNLCGPEVYSLKQLLQFVATTMGKHRFIFGLGAGLSNLQAAVFEHLPKKMITRDNVKSMSLPNIDSAPFPAVFGFSPSALASIVPTYLGAQNARVSGRMRYQNLRNHAGRE